MSTLREEHGQTGVASGRDGVFIEVRAFPFTDALQMVLQGEIVDGMTIIAILHAALLRGL